MAAVDVLSNIPGAESAHVATLDDNDLTPEQWDDSHPSLAALSLTTAEVNALVPVVQTTTVAEVPDDADKFNKSFIIDTHDKFSLGINVAGRIDWVRKCFYLQSFVFLSSSAKFRWVKGPSLGGSSEIGEHVGPISVYLPYVGNIDLWAKAENDRKFYLTVKVEFFTRTYTNRYLIIELE